MESKNEKIVAILALTVATFNFKAAAGGVAYQIDTPSGAGFYLKNYKKAFGGVLGGLSIYYLNFQR